MMLLSEILSPTKSVLLKMGKMTIRTWTNLTVIVTKAKWLHLHDVLQVWSTRPTIPLILAPLSTAMI